MKKIIEVFGAGISGCTIARLYAEIGYQVNLYEKKSEIGGNCFDYLDKNEIYVHKYGPHIFHTNNDKVIKFVKRFSKFNGYKHQVLANIKSKLVPLPINFKSIRILFKKEANEIINLLKKNFKNLKYVTLFDLMKSKNPKIKKFVKYLYDNLYANYTAKMWGSNIKNIDHSVISRVKIILSDFNNYFPEDKFQGLPIVGYTNMMKKIITHKNIHLFLNSKKSITFGNNNIYIQNKPNKNLIFYSGPIDELLNYKYGVLPYRSLRIDFINLRKQSFQKSSVVNYPAHKTMTRITEYKKMTLQKSKNTVISKEYPGKYDLKSKKFFNRYYPIHNQNSTNTYNKYKIYLKKFKNFYPLGRLAEYKYYDMDDAILNTINLFNNLKYAYEK